MGYNKITLLLLCPTVEVTQVALKKLFSRGFSEHPPAHSRPDRFLTSVLCVLFLFTLVLSISNKFVALLALVEQLPTLAMEPFVLLFELVSLL